MILDIQDIINSVSVPALIKDDFIRQGSFVLLKNGDLQAYVGGFSIVFPVDIHGEKWAFRCWHADVGNTKKRYQTISEAIKKANCNFLCDFQYVEDGINVDGTIYPTTRMRWIDGISIKDYICQNRNSKETLTELADNFLKMIHAMHAKSLAHGDLQHGNILVDDNHQLFLVDYDSFYCPKLKGEADTVTGLQDYQHPSRIRNKSVSEKLDYFSELIIYLSILAIAEQPSLLDKYKVEDADRLLFSKEDFSDLANSQIYHDIQSLGSSFKELLSILETYLSYDKIDDLLPFDTYLLEKNISFSSSATKVVRNTQSVTINWDVPFEAEVCLKKGQEKQSKCNNKGHKTFKLGKSTTFALFVKKKGGLKIKKTISIDVFDESDIEFSASRLYSFPTVPVVLSWKVRNAKKIWLDKEVVKSSGAKTIEPETDTTVVLSAEDEFGIKEKQILIRMLPLPVIKSLMAPLPNIANSLSINVVQPKIDVNVVFPEIDIGWVKTKVARVPSFTELGLNVELLPVMPKFNLKRCIKSIISHVKSNNIWKKFSQK